MGLNNLGLGFVFTAKDLASAKLQGLERNFVNLDDKTKASSARISASFRQMAIGLGVFAAGAATVAGAFHLAGAAGEFEQGLASVGAVTRATTRDMDMLRQAAIQAGIETQFSPAEAVQGLQSLATAGQTVEQSTRTLVPVLDLAAGSLGQLGVAQAAEAVVGTLNAYGLAAEQAAGVTDKLLRITQLTNFQARDFEIGLSKAAATGATFNQSMDDVLITMGLLRNRNIDASSSATALRESIRRVGSDQRAQQAIQEAGVKVFDQVTGKMRSITDVMSDFGSATANMTDAERNRRVVTAFGARGLLAFNAVLNASFTTMRDGQEVTLRGADAIEAMRKEMDKAGGTAAGFREKLLDTFEGQKTLLRGTLQTFAIVLGEPFAKVFKPIVGAVTNALNFLIQAFQVIPAPVKKAFATFAVAAGAIVALIGAVIAAKAGIALLAIGLKALGITIGGVLATLLPAILIFGVLASVVAGFVLAVRKNIGGIGTFFRRLYDQIKLFVHAMSQLFEEGAFSGAVMEELNRAENQGVKTFAIRVFQIVFRIKRFFAGIAEGFGTAIEQARPVFDAFVGALSRLGEAFGFVGSGLDTVAGLHSDKFAASGARVGEILGRIATFMVRVITVAVDLTTGIIEGFKSVSGFVGAAFGTIGEAFGDVGKEIKGLLASIGLITPGAETTTSALMAVGSAIAQVIGGIVGVIGLAIAGVVRVVAVVIGLFRNVGESLGRIAAGFVQLFFDPVEGIKNIVGGLLGYWLSFVNVILSLFGGGIDDIQGTVDAFGAAIAEFFTVTIPGWVKGGLSAVGQFFIDVWGGITGFIGGVVTTIGAFFGNLWDGLIAGITAVGAFYLRIVLGIRDLFIGAWTTIGSFTGGVVDEIGAFFGELWANLTTGLATMSSFFTSTVQGIGALFVQVWTGITSFVGYAISEIGGFFTGLWQNIVAELTGVAAFFGRILAGIKSLFVNAGAGIIEFFTTSIPAAAARIVAGIKAFFSPVVGFVRGIFQSIMSAVDRVVAFLGGLAAKIPSQFRPAFLDKVVAAGEAATTRIAGRETEGATRLMAPARGAAAVPVAEGPFAPGALAGPEGVSAAPAVAEVRARATSDERLIEAVTASGAQNREAADRASERPINVRLDVDGDTLATTTVRAQRESAMRSFSPVPAT